MRVLVACEFSGIVREAFARLGHDAWSCDLLPSEIPGNHIMGDVFHIIRPGKWDLLTAHPPCTYLCNSGVRHLYDKVNGKARWRAMHKAAQFFVELLAAPIPLIAIENPIMHSHARTLIKQTYSQIIQPWQFGHGETKATCLWLKGLPELKPSKIVSGRVARVHLEPPSQERWKNRSRTYQGIANAMAKQWGRL